MSKTTSLICALITTFIWGTAFIAQDTGMDNIGPLSFNAARFFVGFLTILPMADQLLHSHEGSAMCRSDSAQNACYSFC